MDPAARHPIFAGSTFWAGPRRGGTPVYSMARFRLSRTAVRPGYPGGGLPSLGQRRSRRDGRRGGLAGRGRQAAVPGPVDVGPAGRRRRLTPQSGSVRRPRPGSCLPVSPSTASIVHLVLDRFTPAERTAFIANDVFEYSLEAVTAMLVRTPAAFRKLGGRAWCTGPADVGRTRFRIEPAEQHLISERCIAAPSSGDVGGLLVVPDPDVVGEGDIGGRVGFRIVTGGVPIAMGRGGSWGRTRRPRCSRSPPGATPAALRDATTLS
jgi:hypothetical protein